MISELLLRGLHATLKKLSWLFFFLPFFIFSQTDTLKEKTTLFDFYFSGGTVAYPAFSISQNDFKKVIPSSQILSGDIMKANFNNFANDSAGGYAVTGANKSLYFQAGITLKLKNKEFRGAGPWLKVGMNYFSSSTILNTGVFRSKTVNNDSAYFVGSSPVNQRIVDRQSVTYAYSCQSINLEGTLVYRLNPNGIFSLFGGPGAFLGLNFDGKAKLVSTEDKTTKDYFTESVSGKVLSNTTTKTSATKEEFSISPNMAFGLFVNVGIDLRLGTNYDYIKNTHLFAEIKPMFRAYGVKNAALQSGVILVANIGLRYQVQ